MDAARKRIGLAGGLLRSYRPRMTSLAAMVFLLFQHFAAAQDNRPGFDDLARSAAEARQSQNISQAIDLYRQAVQIDPKWPDGWWYLGSMQYATNQYAGAIDALTHYIELTPNATAALALRGLSEFEVAEYSQSLTDLQQSLSLGAANQPQNEQVLRFHDALLLTRLGRFEEALQQYDYFVRNGIDNPDVLEGIGLAGLRRPLLAKEVEPSQRDLVMTAGGAAFRFMTGDQGGAEQAFQGLFQRFPASPSAHYLYGYLLFPKDPDHAIAEFKRAGEMEPSDAGAEAMLAWSLLIRSNASEAKPYAETAVKDNPGLPLAQLVLGKSLVETGNVKNGIAHLQKALRLEPRNLEVHIALVKGYSEAGMNGDARREREYCLDATKDEVNQVVR